MNEESKLSESMLFEPIASYFEELGYKVNGEVNGCDLAATKEDELLIVELKKTINLEVILQGVERQKLGDVVYIAAFKPKNFKKNQRFKRICHLLRRLEIGLIFVSYNRKEPVVEIVLTAEPFDRIKSRSTNKRKRNHVLKELQTRKSKTTGGIHKTKVMTVYRERAIMIGELLEANGPMAPRKINIEELDKKIIYSILTKNFYGWFIRIDKGIYHLSEQWRIDQSLRK